MPTGIYVRTEYHKSIYKRIGLKLKGSNNSRWESKEVFCAICNKSIFLPPNRIKKVQRNYCSKKCRQIGRSKFMIGKNNSIWRGGFQTKKCKICNNEFKVYPYRKDTALFCSRNCLGKFVSNNVLTSEIRKQNGLKVKGSNCWLWKGGITPLTKIIRHLLEYKQWVKTIFSRDNYTCQDCFIVGANLHAHHIRPFSDIFNEFLQRYNQFSPIEDKETLTKLAIAYQPFWDINNGITICKKCHIDKTLKAKLK